MARRARKSSKGFPRMFRNPMVGAISRPVTTRMPWLLSGQGRGGLLQPDAQGVFVHRLDLLDILIVWPDPRFDLRIDDAVNIPLGGLRVEVRAVVEGHPFMQVEDIRPALVEHLP